MARTISANAQAKLATRYGTEPLVLVEIQWVEDGQRCLYADRRIADSVVGQMVELSDIDAVVKADGSSDSTQMEVVLEDTDGAIKAIIDRTDIHKRPVWVYQSFDGLDLADKFLLFKGEINSPAEWNEGDRTVRLSVTTRVEDVEAGFSMEEGDFPSIPEDALGKAWPLCFGTVCDVKVPQVRSPRYGVLQSGTGIRDFTLEPRICQAKYIQCPNVPLGTVDQISQTQDQTTGANQYEITTQDHWGPDQSCVQDRFDIICDLMYQLQQQQAHEHATITVVGGEKFPQNERVTLNIEGGKFTGHFEGATFHVAEREHPDKATTTVPACTPIADRAFAQRAVLEQGNWVQTLSGSAWYDQRAYETAPQDVDEYCNQEIQSQVGRKSVGGPVDSREAYDDMPTSSFFWARAGSKVYLEAEAEVLFIVNLLPSTILRVAAYYETAFGSKLRTVPADLYTIYETDYDGYTVTEIGMSKPLSQMDEKWSDDIYVTLTSSVGPNPVDIIEWLLTKYTRLSIDSGSFGHVRTRLANYPANFALLERKNVMDLVADIALQSRCVLYVRNDTVYLKYASEEPTPAATIGRSDVLAGTLKLNLSSTEEISTKHVVTWRKSHADGEGLRIILKHNVAKYGTHEREWDYYTQNIYENVLKSATFWMIRYANAWKTVEFSTTLKHLALEVFDCVLLDLPDVAPEPVKAVITGIKYDISNQELRFTCWMPLRAGETAPYLFAWPADVDRHAIFPTAAEREAGLGYQFIVAPPTVHLLASVSAADDGNPHLRLTSGDEHPSDLDDDAGTCFCPSTDEPIFEEEDPTIETLKKINRDQLRQSMDAVQASRGANDKDRKEIRSCGTQHFGGGCLYEVKVTYVTPHLVGQGNTGGPGCSGPCDEGGPGIVCTGTLSQFCHTFGAMFSAWLFYTQKKVEIEALQCGYYTGQTAPYMVWPPQKVAGSNPPAGGECEDAPGDPAKPNQGEVAEPGQVY